MCLLRLALKRVKKIVQNTYETQSVTWITMLGAQLHDLLIIEFKSNQQAISHCPLIMCMAIGLAVILYISEMRNL